MMKEYKREEPKKPKDIADMVMIRAMIFLAFSNRNNLTDDEITNFGMMFKFEKLPSYSQILNIEKCIFFNILAIGIEKEENRKKGFFKNTIKILEDFCKENGISLLVSNILDDNLVKTLNKNGFGIISLGYTNRVSVFEDILDYDDQHCIMNDILKKSYEIHSFKIFKENPNSDTEHV